MPEVFPHVPRNVTEILDFLTDIRSHPAGEVRESLRDATQVLQLGFRLAPEEAMMAQARFRENTAGEWHVPIWSDASWIEAGVAAGASTLAAPEEADYRPGGLAIVLRSWTEWEVVQIASVGAGSLTLAGPPVSKDYPGPVLVAPVGVFISPLGLQFAEDFATVDMELEFRRVDNIDLGASDLQAHLGYPVLADGAVIVAPLDGAITQALDVIDSGFGKVAIEEVQLYKRRRGLLSFADADRSKRWARKRFLHHLRGRDQAFWRPSFRRDFTIVEAFSGTLMRTEQAAWPDPSTLVGRSVQIDTDGTLIHRAISGASVNGAELEITLDSAPPITVPASARLSLMTLGRLDADRIEIEHQFTGRGFVSRCEVPTIEVPA